MPNWGGGASGAASGAVMGSQILPGWGTAIGAGIGGLAGLFGGGGDKMGKVDTMTKEQKALLSQMMQMLGPQGGLGQGMQSGIDYQRQLMNPNSEAVNQFAQPYINEFNQQTVPGLAERFAGMGGGMGGGMSSSGFGQSLGAAGGNLQAQLAQLKGGLGQQAAQNLMGQYGSMAGQAMGAQPFGYQQPQRPQQGLGEGFLQSWGQAGMPGAKEMGQGISDWWQTNPLNLQVY